MSVEDKNINGLIYMYLEKLKEIKIQINLLGGKGFFYGMSSI